MPPQRSLLGRIALAAWVAPPSAPPSPDVRPAVAAVPATNFMSTPATVDVQRGVLPVDDDVRPASTRAAAGECDHAL